MTDPTPARRSSRRRTRGRGPHPAPYLAAALVAGVLIAVTMLAWPDARTAKVSSSASATGVTASSVAVASRLASEAPRALRPAPDRLPRVARRLVKHGPRDGGRVVALTFDLCATADDAYGFDRKVVDELIATKTPATFFMGGRWAERHPREARLLAAVPYFEIANHSYSHDRFPKMSDVAIRSDLLAAQRAIFRVTGRTPHLMRIPFDDYDSRLIRLSAACGLTPISADVRSGDPDPGISGARIASYVPATVGPGSIVLMHANGNGVHTAEGLPGLLKGLKKRGFRPVTVGAMLGIAADEAATARADGG